MYKNEREGLYGILLGIGSIICIIILIIAVWALAPVEMDPWEKLGAMLGVSIALGGFAVVGTVVGLFYSIFSLVDEPSKYGFISLGLNLGLVVFFLVILGISFQ